MRPDRVHPEAEAELQEAAIWYESQRSGLGWSFLSELDRAFEAILARPRSFQRLEDGPPGRELRRALLDRFPYAIVFWCREERLDVLAVAHTRRQPGYWRPRIAES